MNENIGKNLIRIRKEKGLSAKSVAKLLDMEEVKYISWEMCSSQPNPEDLLKISETLGIDYAELLNDANQKVPSAKNFAKKVTFHPAWTIVSMSLVALFNLLLIMNVFSTGDVFGHSSSISYWQLFSTKSGWIMIPLLILLISVYFIVDGIIKLSSRNIAESMYGKVSCIIKIVLSFVLLICFLVPLIALGDELSIKYGILAILLVALLTLIAFILTECISALKNKEKSKK